MMKLLNKGFTLVELMLAVAILLIAVLGLLGLFINCLISIEANRNLATAVNDAQYVLEQIKGLAYSEITTYAAPQLKNINNSEAITLTRNITYQITEVTVNVSWTERQGTRNFQMSTRFAR